MYDDYSMDAQAPAFDGNTGLAGTGDAMPVEITPQIDEAFYREQQTQLQQAGWGGVSANDPMDGFTIYGDNLPRNATSGMGDAANSYQRPPSTVGLDANAVMEQNRRQGENPGGFGQWLQGTFQRVGDAYVNKEMYQRGMMPQPVGGVTRDPITGRLVNSTSIRTGGQRTQAAPKSDGLGLLAIAGLAYFALAA